MSDASSGEVAKGNVTKRVVKTIPKRLIKLFAGTFASGIVSRAIILFMTIILARQLSPNGYGNFIFATGVAMLAAQLAGMWTNRQTCQYFVQGISGGFYLWLFSGELI